MSIREASLINSLHEKRHIDVEVQGGGGVVEKF